MNSPSSARRPPAAAPMAAAYRRSSGPSWGRGTCTTRPSIVSATRITTMDRDRSADARRPATCGPTHHLFLRDRLARSAISTAAAARAHRLDDVLRGAQGGGRSRANNEAGLGRDHDQHERMHTNSSAMRPWMKETHAGPIHGRLLREIAGRHYRPGGPVAWASATRICTGPSRGPGARRWSARR